MQDLSRYSLPEIAAGFGRQARSLSLDGSHLSVPQIVASFRSDTAVNISEDPQLAQRMERSYQAMMSDIQAGRPVYGCNTAYGGRAGRVLNGGKEGERLTEARRLSEALVFLDVGVGKPLPKEIIRASMVIRANMLLQGVSGIRLSQVQKLTQLLNADITPLVKEHGGVGASGDLIHNQRVVSVARGLPGAKAISPEGRVQEAADLLEEYGIEPLILDPKEGLALVNGDNFSTAMAVYVANRVMQYFLVSMALSAMTIEVLLGTDRSFHPLLAHVRAHAGQKEIADIYRFLLQGSKLAHQELAGPHERAPGVKVQDVYSLRCLPQYEGIMLEKLKWCLDTIGINANSVSDNPLWVPDELATEGEKPWQWVSGGNFLAMHMAEVLDTLRKITTQLVKKNDRHLARLVDIADNNDLPPNLSDPDHAVTHCTFKGIQILSGMLEVQSGMLANPVTTQFGIHEERNQDITSHATTSGNLALKNLELLTYSLAGNLLAVAQAVDLRGGGDLLSPQTRPLYEYVRAHCDMVLEERPLQGDMETMAARLEDESLVRSLLEQVYPEFRTEAAQDQVHVAGADNSLRQNRYMSMETLR